MSYLIGAINPKKRKRSKKRRSRKGRMPAALRRYWASRRAGKSHVKHHRRSKRRVRSVARTVRRVKRRARTIIRRIRIRRNPRGLSGDLQAILKRDVIPATIGAGGAVAIDILWGALPFLNNFAANNPTLAPLAPVARIITALGLGWLAGQVANKHFGEMVAIGATTVTVADLIKTWMTANMPSVPMAGYVNGYVGNRPRRYMGYMSPARVVPSLPSNMGMYVR